jgi:ABC-2 type transport system ATP-binding protein
MSSEPVEAEARPPSPRQGSAKSGAKVPLLVVRALRKSFGDRVAVSDVSFEISAGHAYGLLGPNGAGKTTTIRMICGLLQPDSGDLLVQGRRIDKEPLLTKAAIGFVPHEIALYTDISAMENLRFWGRMYGLAGKTLHSRACEALEFVGLAGRADDKVAQFSGGMQRRLNLAVALVHQPKLLVLDEPTVGVDPQSRTAILDRLADLRAGGVAILYTTHYMDEVERFCDTIGIIDQGKLIAEGSRRELLDMIGGDHRITVHAEGNLGALARDIHELAGVREVRAGLEGLTVMAEEGGAALASIVEAGNRRGVTISSIEVSEPDLEHVFLHLTGRELRD